MKSKVKVSGTVRVGAQLSLGLPKPKKRKKPGPKRDPRRHDPEHRRRPEHEREFPIHVVLRVANGVPRLRGFDTYPAIRAAIARIPWAGFRVIHASIQDNHLHFIIETENKRSLSMGMQGLAISLAKRLNVVRGRGGKVFAHRYHATPIRTPRQMRNSLSYVLNNWRHHREDRDRRRRFGALDPFATGFAFTGWSTSTGWYENWAGIPAVAPETWLLRVGWQRGGAPISPYECPR